MPDPQYPRIVRLRASGFQSLLALDIPVAPVTVLLGRNDQGKSATTRALMAALLNRAGAKFIRDDCDAAEVLIDYADGSTLHWQKPRKGGAHYTVTAADGTPTELSRVGRDLPATLTDVTGVREIDIDGVKYNVQLAEQHSLPFLIYGSGGQAAKLLARVSNLDVVVVAGLAAKRERDKHIKTASGLHAAAEIAAWTLAFQPHYPTLRTKWYAIKSRLDGIHADEAKIADAREASKRIPALRSQLARQAALGVTWERLELPTRVSDMEARIGRLNGHKAAVVRYRLTERIVAELEPALERSRGVISLDERSRGRRDNCARQRKRSIIVGRNCRRRSMAWTCARCVAGRWERRFD